ncbi:hypothetical protein T06_1048 [Trichinella sp. T6]|nr:hypothetical protein T06_1048 [Trichinella sp. T6]
MLPTKRELGKRGIGAGSNRTDDTDAEMNPQVNTGTLSFGDDCGSNPVEATKEPARERGSLQVAYSGEVVPPAKVAVRKTVGRSLLTFDELQTVLCEVEARINDATLTLVSSGTQEELTLTPAHFLIRKSWAALPHGNGGVARTGMKHLLRRWAHQKKITAHLWKRWRCEYVTTMNRRGKWQKIQEAPRVEDITFVGDAGTPKGR